MSDLAVVGIPNGQFVANSWLVADPDAQEEMECLPDRLKGRKYFQSDEQDQ